MPFVGRDEIKYADDSTAQKVAIVDASGAQMAVADNTPLAAKTAVGNGWDSGTGAEIAIPDNTIFLHVYIDKIAYLVASASTDDPAQNGAIYAAAQTHIIPCIGMSYLHYKNGTADDHVTVYATAFLSE